MALKDQYGFCGSSGRPPSQPNLITPRGLWVAPWVGDPFKETQLINLKSWVTYHLIFKVNTLASETKNNPTQKKS